VTKIDEFECKSLDKLKREQVRQRVIRVSLIYSGIGVEGAKVLAQVLPRCSHLTELNLTKDTIGGEGAAGSPRALKQAEKL
jgi:hypothetical protein